MRHSAATLPVCPRANLHVVCARCLRSRSDRRAARFATEVPSRELSTLSSKACHQRHPMRQKASSDGCGACRLDLASRPVANRRKTLRRHHRFASSTDESERSQSHQSRSSRGGSTSASSQAFTALASVILPLWFGRWTVRGVPSLPRRKMKFASLFPTISKPSDSMWARQSAKRMQSIKRLRASSRSSTAEWARSDEEDRLRCRPRRVGPAGVTRGPVEVSRPSTARRRSSEAPLSAARADPPASGRAPRRDGRAHPSSRAHHPPRGALTPALDRARCRAGRPRGAGPARAVAPARPRSSRASRPRGRRVRRPPRR